MKQRMYNDSANLTQMKIEQQQNHVMINVKRDIQQVAFNLAI